jgi:RimJ/RimL family protein N-acetyltransferase
MSPTIRTKRLILRPASMADAEPIARYLNNFAVSGNLARVPYPYTVTDAERWLGSQRPEPRAGDTGFGIELPGAGYVGHVGFHLDGEEAELGYWLGEPFWHRGLMTEAARAAVDWYFGVSPAPSIRSGVFHFNKASLAIQRKLGFTETGVSSRHCLARGEEVRHIDTQLSRADWAGAKP